MASGLTAQNLMDFFNKKIESVRQTTGGTPVRSSLPAATSFLNIFHTYNPDEIQKVIMMAPSKSCQLDPLPTHNLTDFSPEPPSLHNITEMCNGSLEVGCLPLSQRHAIVQPRLKKATADPENMKKYRPISNLTFIQSNGETSLPSNLSLSGSKTSCYQQCSMHTDVTIRRKQQY